MWINLFTYAYKSRYTPQAKCMQARILLWCTYANIWPFLPPHIVWWPCNSWWYHSHTYAHTRVCTHTPAHTLKTIKHPMAIVDSFLPYLITKQTNKTSNFWWNKLFSIWVQALYVSITNSLQYEAFSPKHVKHRFHF